MENINSIQTESIKNIKNKLTNNGWNINAEYQSGIYFSKGRFLGVISVSEREYAPAFCCRIALQDLFDRWANSGSEKIMESEQDVIRYYFDYENFAFDACCEIIGEVIDKDLENKNYYLPTITKMIEMFLPEYTESR